MSEQHTALGAARRPPRPRHSTFCERHAGLISILAMLHLGLVALALSGGTLCPRTSRPIRHVVRAYQALSGLVGCPEDGPEDRPEVRLEVRTDDRTEARR